MPEGCPLLPLKTSRWQPDHLFNDVPPVTGTFDSGNAQCQCTKQANSAFAAILRVIQLGFYAPSLLSKHVALPFMNRRPDYRKNDPEPAARRKLLKQLVVAFLR